MEKTVTYLMPSASVVSLAKSPSVKAASCMHRISPNIYNKFICMGGQMNDIKKQASGLSKEGFLLSDTVLRLKLIISVGFVRSRRAISCESQEQSVVKTGCFTEVCVIVILQLGISFRTHSNPFRVFS